MDVFDRLAPYIQDYIYYNRWTELREVQVAACDIIFNTDHNLLLSTGTASGKTEAAFLPALTKLYEEPSESTGILYISPLKALINDQFFRLDYLLQEGNVPVCRWHGDVSASVKNKFIKNPQGVLQITPESLESMLINKQTLGMKLFGDLRFVIIDEVHYFMGSERGIQLLCLLERIQKFTGATPRRIGLSATLGDYSVAEKWLSAGTGRPCSTPIVNGGKRRVGLAMQRFTKRGDETKEQMDSGETEHFQYLYQNTLGKKAIIFTNARSEAEFTIANLKKIAEEKRTPDIYRIHHGSISAILREETEKEMKESDAPIVTGATVTLELGMDIGSLDRVVQIGTPFSVSSFTQRLGRCGRRGQAAELLFTFMDEDSAIGTDPFREMNWEFLRAVAILQLYLEEKWVEPIETPRFPYALLYHQTMAYLTANGEVSAAVLAQNVLTLTPFQQIPQADYQLLLRHLIEIEQIQRTERGGLIVGRMGEMVVSHYEFYAVFDAPVEYLVKSENEAIGTVQEIIPVGSRFALAGRSWECLEINSKSKTIFVRRIKGIARITWKDLSSMEVHTHVLQKMQEVLVTRKEYAYMSESCTGKLDRMRAFAVQSGFAKRLITPLSDHQFGIFPWLGTKQLYALQLALQQKNVLVKNEDYFLVAVYDGSIQSLQGIVEQIMSGEADKYEFLLPEGIQIPCKFNDFVPDELLKKQFIEDYVDIDGMRAEMYI